MTKDVLIGGILSISETIKPHVGERMHRIKLIEGYFEMPEDLELLLKPELQEAYKWISEIHDTVFQDFMKVKRLLPEDRWESYEDWDCFDDTQEVVALNKAKVALRAALVKQDRPAFWKKGKRNATLKSRRSAKAKKANN